VQFNLGTRPSRIKEKRGLGIKLTRGTVNTALQRKKKEHSKMGKKGATHPSHQPGGVKKSSNANQKRSITEVRRYCGGLGRGQKKRGFGLGEASEWVGWEGTARPSYT